MFSDKHFALAAVAFPGRQYILNSGAALATALLMGADRTKAVEAVKSFPGTARRLEVIKPASKNEPAIIIDDYAHHPTAISITLEGVAKMYSGYKLVAIFQPHMFSRTAVLLDEFAKSFSIADEVGLMEIYASARETGGAVSGKDLFAKAKQYHEHVTYLPTHAAGREFVKQFVKQKAVIVLMGAGDVYTLVS
jgi:UDP-N-acetylmuramate--alanine ligase